VLEQVKGARRRRGNQRLSKSLVTFLSDVYPSRLQCNSLQPLFQPNTTLHRSWLSWKASIPSPKLRDWSPSSRSPPFESFSIIPANDHENQTSRPPRHPHHLPDDSHTVHAPQSDDQYATFVQFQPFPPSISVLFCGHSFLSRLELKVCPSVIGHTSGVGLGSGLRTTQSPRLHQ
jgi:hypothetical protein